MSSSDTPAEKTPVEVLPEKGDELFEGESEITIPFTGRLTVRRSRQVGKLVAALIAAQLEYDVVAKDAENPAYARGNKVSKYATLDSAVTATRPHLNKHGLAIIQHLQSDNATRELIVTTSLYHTSEQFFESDLSLPSIGQGNRFDPQTLASASTYGRRITWLAIAGAAPADDDDANKASGVGTREAAQAVGQAKIDAYKAKKGEKAAPGASEGPTNGTPSLFYALQPSGQYAITGDRDLLKKMWPQLKGYWQDHAQCFMLSDEQLEVVKFQCETAKIDFHVLKGPKA